MALSSEILSELIKSNIGTLDSDSLETNEEFLKGTARLADAIAKAVVQHLTTQAVVEMPVGSINVVTPQGNGNNIIPAIGVIK